MTVSCHMENTQQMPLTHPPPGQALTAMMREVCRLHGLWLAAGERLTHPLGLSSARWQVLSALYLAGEPLPVAYIARHMGLTRQSVQRTVDILAAVTARPKAPYCVGFAAETNDVNENAEAKRRRKKLPLLVANRAQDTLGQDENEVTLLDDAGAHPLPRMDKLALARRLVAEIAQRLPRT